MSQASLRQNRPKGDCELCVVKSGLGQEPSVQPEEMSKQKTPEWREVEQLAGKKSKAPQLSSSPAPSTPVLIQATRLDRSEVSQPSENEEVRQADILIACLVRKV